MIRRYAIFKNECGWMVYVILSSIEITLPILAAAGIAGTATWLFLSLIVQ